jgi:hypothetical protein
MQLNRPSLLPVVHRWNQRECAAFLYRWTGQAKTPAFVRRSAEATFPKCDVTDERKQGTMLDSDRRSVEEHLARELLNYFTGQHPTGVKYEDQPPEVRELWLGAARVAMKVLQDISPLIL